MKNKQGISLIVLSITILVMAILAATAIIALEDSGIIKRSKDTVAGNNYADEMTRLIVIKNGILTDNLGEITVEEYITELTNKGLIETGRTNNADGSITVTTKTGFEVIISQNGTSDLTLEIEGYTPPTSSNNGNNTGNAGSNGNGNVANGLPGEGEKVLDGFKIAMDEYFWGETVQIEDSDKYNAANPMKPIYDSMQTFEYDANMTWRQWVNSSYNTYGYKILVADGATEGYSGESIVTSDSRSTLGCQVQISSLIIYYNDAACTQLATDEEYIVYHGKICTAQIGLFDLDTKIEDTLNSMVVTVTPFYNIYEKRLPFFVFGYYED